MGNGEKKDRINMTLPPEIAEPLNNYCLEYSRRKGSISFGMKTQIARLALKEWLEKHGKDFTIKLEEE